jgi:hypothetical protein
LLDLGAQRFVDFWISPFTQNDQSASPWILPWVRAGDLVIRDLGYFVRSVLEAIHQRGAFFVSRLRCDTVLRDTEGRPMDLLEKVRGCRRLDLQARLGVHPTVPVRLIALRLPESLAAERRRKARQNRDRRLRPDARRMELLGWALYLTNASESQVSLEQVARLYAIRWRIETLFKAWKSHFRVEEFSPGSLEEVQCVVLARLLVVSLFEVSFAAVRAHLAERGSDRAISYLRMAQLVSQLGGVLLAVAVREGVEEWLPRQIEYHCCYDRRRKRRNFAQSLAALS